MSRQLLYKRQPWYARELPSQQELRRACEILRARTQAWLRKPLRPSELLREAESRWRRNPRKTALRAAEVCLWVVAIASLGFCSIAYGGAAIHQAREKAILASLRANAAGDAHAGAAVRAANLKAPDEVLLGLIEIPRLDTSAIVEEGVSSRDALESGGAHSRDSVSRTTRQRSLGGTSRHLFLRAGRFESGRLGEFQIAYCDL